MNDRFQGRLEDLDAQLKLARSSAEDIASNIRNEALSAATSYIREAISETVAEAPGTIAWLNEQNMLSRLKRETEQLIENSPTAVSGMLAELVSFPHQNPSVSDADLDAHRLSGRIMPRAYNLFAAALDKLVYSVFEAHHFFARPHKLWSHDENRRPRCGINSWFLRAQALSDYTLRYSRCLDEIARLTSARTELEYDARKAEAADLWDKA